MKQWLRAQGANEAKNTCFSNIVIRIGLDLSLFELSFAHTVRATLSSTFFFYFIFLVLLYKCSTIFFITSFTLAPIQSL